MRVWMRAAAAMFVLVGAAAGCGNDGGGDTSQQAEDLADEVRQQAREAADAVGQAGETAGARTIAEAVRAALMVKDLDTDQSLRTVDVLRGAVASLPGEPKVTGIDDTDGDGRDDDGQLEVAVDSERACLFVPDGGDNIDVKSGAC